MPKNDRFLTVYIGGTLCNTILCRFPKCRVLHHCVSHGFFSISQSQKNIARFLAHLTEISQRISQKYRPNIRVFGRFHENFKPNVGKYLKKLCFDDDIQVKIWETKDIAKVFKKYGQKLVKFET